MFLCIYHFIIFPPFILTPYYPIAITSNNMNSKNNLFPKINTANIQPSPNLFSNTPKTNTAINNNFFSNQKPTPIPAPSANPMNPLSQGRALPQTSPAPFAPFGNSSNNRPMNQQPNMSITSSPSLMGNMAQKGNFAQPLLASNMNQTHLSANQMPRMK